MDLREYPIVMTSKRFEWEVLMDPRPFLILVYSDWSDPCQLLRQNLLNYCASAKESVRWGLVEINEAFASVLSSRYLVRSVPTILFFRNGVLMDKLVGLRGQKELAQKCHFFLYEYPKPDADCFSKN
jgi:thioredoxin 1